jgi:hypothetical protein
VQPASPGPIEVVINRTIAEPDNIVSCHLVSFHAAFPHRFQDGVVLAINALQCQCADLLHVVRAIFFCRRRCNDGFIVFNLEDTHEVGSGP